jgi:hypothetical protein
MRHILIHTSQVRSGFYEKKDPRYEPENMQIEHFQNPSQRLHIAATISYHHKGALQFYYDENNNKVRPRKPRKNKSQTDTQFQENLVKWEASLPGPPQGNLMN